MTELAFVKGHGTRNDFVLFDDRDNKFDLTSDLVRKLADRHAGIGADGVIRVVASRYIDEGAEILKSEPHATWFMDYRNADGSIAQMCGNGVRVFAAYLEALGLVSFSGGETITIGTRAGARTVSKQDGWYRVGMGTWSMPYATQAETSGYDATVTCTGLEPETSPRPGLSVDMGNPHTVIVVESTEQLRAINLQVAPHVEPVPPHGTNVEIVVPLNTTHAVNGHTQGHIAMRVHERGVGETQSCGTGACAAAAAVRYWAHAQHDDNSTPVPDSWLVDVPGGQVQVDFADDYVWLSGPATLVAHGTAHIELL
ncbi:diaminopimelate epimerase [Timonella sp. A28]|uniref:diaminopimelate epimerase n=1 Tax=Timonella sp. A28 TaxID=3442640 RepID=UPI003EBD8C7C